MGGQVVHGTVKLRYEVFNLDGTSDIQSIVVKATAIKYVEHDYGADADGNRGISITFYEDVEVDKNQIEYDVANYLWDCLSENGKLPKYQIKDVDEDSFEED